MEKSLQKKSAEVFFVLQWRGQSGKAAAKTIGHSQATLNRWAKDFKSNRLIDSVVRIQSLRSNVFRSIRKEKLDIPKIQKILWQIERLNKVVSKLTAESNCRPALE